MTKDKEEERLVITKIYEDEETFIEYGLYDELDESDNFIEVSDMNRILRKGSGYDTVVSSHKDHEEALLCL